MKSVLVQQQNKSKTESYIKNKSRISNDNSMMRNDKSKTCKSQRSHFVSSNVDIWGCGEVWAGGGGDDLAKSPHLAR